MHKDISRVGYCMKKMYHNILGYMMSYCNTYHDILQIDIFV